MSVKVVQAGPLTTIQDTGRFGYQQYGVVVGGAMDALALRTANLLVGNRQNAPALEITLTGFKAEFQAAAYISICGGNLSPHADGMPVPMWRPVHIKPGTLLTFPTLIAGCRAYLAVGGEGFAADLALGSAGTYLAAGVGGYSGRQLRDGDIVRFAEQPPGMPGHLEIRAADSQSGCPFVSAFWQAGGDIIPPYSNSPTIRVVRGPEADWFQGDSEELFYRSEYRIGLQSNRMGYRLEGPELKAERSAEMISEAVSFGTVQVTPDGRPIVLMADRQTTGGYPRIAQIASVDMSLVAQLKPGDRIRFEKIGLRDASALLLRQEKLLSMLQAGVKLKHMH